MKPSLAKQSIVAALEARNEVRRASGLPLLDVDRELALALRVEAIELRRRRRQRREHDRPEIAQQVIDDFLTRGIEGKTPFGRWAIRAEVLRRLDADE